MAGSLGDLFLTVGANVSGFRDAMSDVLGDLGKTSGGFDAFAGKISGVGSVLTGALTVPLTAIGGAALAAGLQFDEAMDSIRAGTGAAGAALAGLGDSFKAVLGTVPSSAKETADAIEGLNVRLGLTGPTLEAMSTQLLNLARITDTQVAPLIVSTTRLFGDWTIATEDQANTLDFLFRTSQATGIEIKTLTDLVVQFGAPLRALGFSLQEGAALLGKWEKEGVNLETVLSGLRFALGKFAAAGREPQAAFEQVKNAIANAKTESEATAIAFENFGKRAATDMSRAIIEGRFNIDALVKSLSGSSETINKAAADTLSLADKLKLVKNQASAALEPLGTALVSALEKILDAGRPVIQWLTDLSKWFADLDPQWQMAIIGAGGLAAALGPVLVAVGAIIGPLTSLVALLGGAGPILAVVAGGAAAVAAAFALWQIEPIRDAVLGLWEGMKSLGLGIASVFSAMSPFVDLFTQVASAIGSVVLQLAGAGLIANLKLLELAAQAVGFVMREVLAPALKFTVDQIVALIDWVAKLPGVSNVLDRLKDATTALKGAFTDSGKTATVFAASVTDTSKAAEKATPKIKRLGVETVEVAGHLKKAEGNLKAFGDQLLIAKVKAYADEHRKLGQEIVRLDTLIQREKDSGKSWHDEAARGSAELARLGVATADLSKVKIPDLITSMNDIAGKTDSVTAAFQRLGIQSSSDLKRVAEESIKARDAVLGSNVTTDFEKKQAVVRALEAQIAAAKAAGEIIPREQAEMLDKMKKEIETKIPDIKRPWEDFGKEVSTVITNAAQSMAKSLFDGDLSFAEKFKNMAKSLGEAIISHFIQPATAALAKFIEGVLTDLLSGKGLGGVLGHLKEIGSSIAGIFGGGSNAVGAAAGAAGSAAGGVGGTAGGIGSAAGQAVGMGVQGVMSIVTGAVSAVSGIISNFQMMGMNKSLDLIEHEVRYSQIHLSYILDQANKYWPWLENIAYFNYNVMAALLNEIASSFAGVDDRLIAIDNLIRSHALPVLEDIRDSIKSFTRSPDVTVNVAGSVVTERELTRTIQNAIAGQLRAQGTLA